MKTITSFCRSLAIGMFLLTGLASKAQNCNASFVYSIMPNGLVNFYSTSTPVNSITTQYWWSFGNSTSYTATGSPTATSTYSANGVFTVNLFVYTPNTTSCQVVMTITITNTSNNCNLVTDFNITYAGNNGVEAFSSTCTGTVAGTTYTYNFGDGSTSNLANCTHTFFSNTPYTITLMADNHFTPACVGTKTIVDYITSVPGCNWTPNFSYTVGANGAVNFSNTSTGGNTYLWSFGDNGTASGATPAHTYLQNGTYTVVLTVKNNATMPPPAGTCIKYKTAVISVSTAPCPANASFSVLPTNTIQYWIAVPSSTLNIANAQWSWGDGTTSNGLFSSHQYSAAGLYTLCLTVTVNCGNTASACSTYSIYRSSAGPTMINVNVMSAENYALLGTGISSAVSDMSSIGIYPNPNNGLFELRANAEIAKPVVAGIYDLVGKKVFETWVDLSHHGSYVLDAGKLPAGVYFIKVDNTTKKLVIEK
jgi:PKD repeat protein